MSCTVRLWSDEDLTAIRENSNPLLTTVFMNACTFGEKEIKVYPYHLRRVFVARFEDVAGLDDEVKVYATDPKTAVEFLRLEYNCDGLQELTEVITRHRTVARRKH